MQAANDARGPWLSPLLARDLSVTTHTQSIHLWLRTLARCGRSESVQPNPTWCKPQAIPWKQALQTRTVGSWSSQGLQQTSPSSLYPSPQHDTASRSKFPLRRYRLLRLSYQDLFCQPDVLDLLRAPPHQVGTPQKQKDGGKAMVGLVPTYSTICTAASDAGLMWRTCGRGGERAQAPRAPQVHRRRDLEGTDKR